MAHDLDTKNHFIVLRSKGWSFSRIAAELHVSKQSLINWNREYRCEISNLKNMELEALQQKYWNSLQKRIRLLGEPLLSVRKELAKRELSEVSTKDLCDMLLKLTSALRREQTQTTFLEKISVDDLFKDLDETINAWPAV